MKERAEQEERKRQKEQKKREAEERRKEEESKKKTEAASGPKIVELDDDVCETQCVVVIMLTHNLSIVHFVLSLYFTDNPTAFLVSFLYLCLPPFSVCLFVSICLPVSLCICRTSP